MNRGDHVGRFTSHEIAAARRTLGNPAAGRSVGRRASLSPGPCRRRYPSRGPGICQPARPGVNRDPCLVTNRPSAPSPWPYGDPPPLRVEPDNAITTFYAAGGVAEPEPEPEPVDVPELAVERVIDLVIRRLPSSVAAAVVAIDELDQACGRLSEVGASLAMLGAQLDGLRSQLAEVVDQWGDV